MTISESGISALGGGTIGNQNMYPGLSQLIVEYAMPPQIFRQLMLHYPSLGYQSVTIPVEDTPSNSGAIVASRLGEGDEIPLNILPVSSNTVTTYKVGEGYQISREMIMFQQVPIIQQRLKRMGYHVGNTIDFDCAATINAGAGASTSVTGTTKGVDNTIVSEANTIGQYDIVNARVRMMTKNLHADTLALHPKGAGHLMKLPQYKAEYLYGKAGYETGEVGGIEGLRVLVTPNCGATATGTIADGVGFVLAGTTTTAPNALGQYTPMGYFVESLPINTMLQDNQRRDAYEIYAVTMYAPVVTKSDAIEKLTGATA